MWCGSCAVWRVRINWIWSIMFVVFFLSFDWHKNLCCGIENCVFFTTNICVIWVEEKAECLIQSNSESKSDKCKANQMWNVCYFQCFSSVSKKDVHSWNFCWKWRKTYCYNMMFTWSTICTLYNCTCCCFLTVLNGASVAQFNFFWNSAL